MNMRFYRCAVCGQIVEIIKDVDVPLMCCGEDMEELIPCSVDASQEKHVPVITVGGNKVIVSVGSVPHPMTKEHRIEWIALETSHGMQRRELKPGMEPKVCFCICEGEKIKCAFAYCNLHMLWKANL